MGNKLRDPEFNHDLKQMMEALESPTVELPASVTNAEEFRAWVKTFDKGENDVGATDK